MTERTWLIDKSALVRLAASPDAEEWAERIGRGLVHITAVTLLEVGFSARSGRDHAAVLGSPPIAAMPIAYSSPRVEDRAVEVQRALARRGHHRTPSVPDLLVAATAELERHTVLHVDKDFELIGRFTDQPLERLATPEP